VSHNAYRSWRCVCADDEGLVLIDEDDEEVAVSLEWTEVWLPCTLQGLCCCIKKLLTIRLHCYRANLQIASQGWV
jgi:hypothetical protein